MNRNVPETALVRIRKLVDATFVARVELYAAAETLHDSRRRHVCEQLANQLANHATELQQLLLANGGESIEPLDVYSVAEEICASAKNRDGDSGVLNIAEGCERAVKNRFDEVIGSTPEGDTEAILKRQRKDIEFGEHVLQSMQMAPKQ